MIPVHAVIVVLVRCLASAGNVFLRPRLFFAFLTFSAVELVLLLGYTHFTHPLLCAVAAPAVAALFGEGVLHYPLHVWFLPVALDWIRAAVTIVVGPALFVRAAGAFPRPERHDGRGARAAAVLVACAAFSLVLIGVQRGVELMELVPIANRLAPLWVVLALYARPLLFVVLADVVLGVLGSERDGWSSLRAGVIAATKSPGMPAAIAFVGAILLAPFHAAVLSAATFVDSGVPDVAGSVAVLAVVWDAPVLAFLFAAARAWRLQRRSLP
jgi:hypothetical protein